MESYVFISYSSKDAGLAHQLVEYLEQNGVRCWIAPRNIPSGRDYTDIIDVAIKGCNGIILIYSDHSAQSVWVKKEITLGVGHKKNIIPFSIRYCRMCSMPGLTELSIWRATPETSA